MSNYVQWSCFRNRIVSFLVLLHQEGEQRNQFGLGGADDLTASQCLQPLNISLVLFFAPNNLRLNLRKKVSVTDRRYGIHFFQPPLS